MASDVAPLVTELADVRRQRGELRDIRREELCLLEREEPAWYRPRARAEHAAATGRATKIVERIDRALRKLDSRENALLEQLGRERAAAQRPERARERAIRPRERDIGLGR